MSSKRIAAGAAAIVMTVSALSSCGTSIIKNEQIKKETKAGNDSSAAVETDAEDTEGEEIAPTIKMDGQTYEDTIFESVDVPYVEYNKTYQAESGTIIGSGAAILRDRANFKGEGYVNGATPDNWSISFDLPEGQFYNITISTASDKGVNSQLYVNGKVVWIFRTSGDGSFAEKHLENIWLDKGINEIKIGSTENQVDVDYVTLESNNDISALNPDLSSSVLSDPNASYRAQAVYQLLCSNYGKQVITAQHVTPSGSDETDAVRSLTGKSPAIRIADIGGYTKNDIKDIGIAHKYFKDGGLVAYDWYWIDPSGKKDSKAIEIKDVAFDVRKAVPAEVEVKEDDSSTADGSDSSSAETASDDTTYTDGGSYDYGYDDGYNDDYNYGYDDGYSDGYTDDYSYDYSYNRIGSTGFNVMGSTDSYPDDLNEDQQSAGSQAAAITSDGVETKTNVAAIQKKPEFSVEEIAAWTPKEYKSLYKKKKITKELYLILKDIDSVSTPLTKFSEKNVPVIWRPLPVASNGLYWWGIDKDTYKWLWQVMYTRMTEYHKLNNLIWVWSAQNADWYVGDSYCDVISADVYTEGNRDAQINTLLSLNNITKTKPIAMTECGALPAIESILSEKAFWSYTALWTEPYFSTETGIAINDTQSSQQAAARFIEYYNNNFTLTLEELPSIPDVAKSIRDAQKKAAEAEKKAAEAAKKEKKSSKKKTSSKKSEKTDSSSNS